MKKRLKSCLENWLEHYWRRENFSVENKKQKGKREKFMNRKICGWKSVRCKMKAKQSKRQNGLRALAVILATVLTITMVPVTQVQAAGYSEAGFDVSSYNGVVDWEQVAEAGMDFVMIRTGEGRAPDVDAQFEANYDGAVEAGVKVGVYHACCVRTPEDAIEEAEYCLEILDGRELDYPVAYDMEREGTFAGGKDNTAAIVKAFCDTIADAGYTPMIYSTYSHLVNDFDWTQLKGYKVWVAAHRDTKPKLDVPFDMWQYTATGSVDGANNDQGNCDLNYSYMEAKSVKFTKTTLTMKKKATAQAKVKMGPSGCTDTKTFKSSNPKVVTVNKKTGKLTAKKKGKATITVTTGSGKKATMKVVVK